PAGASRCYEYPIQTLDVCLQSLEQRDALCFANEYSDEVWVLLGTLLLNLISLLTLVLWIVLMLKAFQGVRFKVPLAGHIAESLSAERVEHKITFCRKEMDRLARAQNRM